MEKVTPRILPGFMELLPADQILFNDMYDKIREVYESFGFLPLDTPVIELSEVLLAKAGGETEKQIYRFQKGDNDLSLRFDLTVPLARYVAQHQNDLVFPFKRYQMSKVYRGERPQKGRFREFYQCDIDIIGGDDLDILYDAEMPAVIYHVFKKLGIGDFTIRINNRKVLGGFFASLGLSDKIEEILRIIDKIEKIGKDKVVEELVKIGVPEESTDKIIDFITITGDRKQMLESLRALGVEDESFVLGVNELETVSDAMVMFGMPEENFRIDLSIARGLDYYTGTVYETTINGHPEFGSVCSGGRYDNLTGYYTDKKLPGIGISIGLTRLFSQLRDNGLIAPKTGSMAKVLVIPMDKDVLPYAVQTANTFRANGIPSDVYYGTKGMKQKMKYAARMGVAYAAIIGTDEATNGVLALKDMNGEGGQKTLSVEEAIEILKN
ncbi:MAG: histidine--tRNA ligase [Clostridia bacterium]|nr:histidine--tRNA ligase [Clostridia bacterium]MBP3554392.1 histidine--tRNA ligase [Clostridia bacterium]MBQ8419672.1 histidine--tRNA ligase [Clostridia bacterium]